MATLRAIIDALRTAAENNESVVLATVTRITGSSYGGVGTRMVSHVDGPTVGIVSGGCLESDLAEHARKVHEQGEAAVVTYDTRADDDAAWGLGLGCNGLIDVFLEPLDPSRARGVAALLDKANNASSASAIATVIGGGSTLHAGDRLLISDNAVTALGNWSASNIEKVRATSPSVFSERRRGIVTDDESGTLAYEVIVPAVKLVVCGSGPDVVPLARIASDLGWNVTVVDHRPVTTEHAARFPHVSVVSCDEPGPLSGCVSLSPTTAAVVMSHHYARDLEYVKALLESDARYIGVLGPRGRSERMLADMSAAGVQIARGERLHAPIGLNIGSDGPDGIALSIVAEVSAVMTGSQVKHLRDHRGALHPAASVRVGR